MSDLAAYEKSFDTLSRNPAALTNADVVALGRFSAAHATEARRHLAARTPPAGAAEALAHAIGDAINRAIKDEDSGPMFDVVQRYPHGKELSYVLAAGLSLTCAAIAGLRKGLAALKSECAELKSEFAAVKTSMPLTLADCYKGAWDGATQYRRGELVSRQGSLWLAQRDSVGTPPGSGGPETSGFVLVVKAGRDATR